MFRLLKSECVPLERELAEKFRDMEGSPTERELKPARIKYLQQQAGAGELVNFYWASVRRDGVVRRMNGNHSSNMLCQLDGFFPQGLYVHLDEYEVDNEEGEALLFRKFDSRQSSRSALDVSGAYQGLYPELVPLNRTYAKLAIDAIAWYRASVLRVDVPSGDDKYLLFDDAQQGGPYHNFLLWHDEIIVSAPELQRVPVVAAMYGTFTKNEEVARTWWESVAEGGDDVNEDHQYKLYTWLKTARDKELAVAYTPPQFYQGCKSTWDAYRSGKMIKDVKFDVPTARGKGKGRRKGLTEPTE